VKNTVYFQIFVLFLCQTTISFAQTAFKDITEPAGIKHQFQVFEGFLGGGACVFDINNDGFDVFDTRSKYL